ncbi:hypothetical protein FQN57_006731 [Myotisia sp. PD_48]|nr:hypothetical protein FQN57_006731 [Myotisia sp. PD_48]
MASPTASAKKAIHKLDVAQVSLNLQDRLGLAKIRYETLHSRNRDPILHSEADTSSGLASSEAISDCSSDFSDVRYSTPFTSSPLRTPRFSRELPRSARSRHAATFDLRTMECMTTGSRKRRRYDIMPDSNLPKMPRILWNAPPPPVGRRSSPPPIARQPHTYQETIPSFVSESDTIPDDSLSPDLPESNVSSHIDPELSSSRINVRNRSSVMDPPSPRTPPPRRNSRFAGHRNTEDGADLLLYLANSPTPATVGGKPHVPEFPPSTPPTQFAGLHSLISTPGQHFNFADFVNVTPSPAQRQWNSRTPLALPKTPRTTRGVRKRLNFDALHPPSSVSPQSNNAVKKAGLALQMAEEIPIS